MGRGGGSREAYWCAMAGPGAESERSTARQSGYGRRVETFGTARGPGRSPAHPGPRTVPIRDRHGHGVVLTLTLPSMMFFLALSTAASTVVDEGTVGGQADAALGQAVAFSPVSGLPSLTDLIRL